MTDYPGRKPLRARLAAAVAYLLTRYAHRLGAHAYLSTGCLHGDHGYCQGMTGLAGKKRPGECKHCGSKCVCECHTPPERTFADGVRQLGEQLDRQASTRTTPCPACSRANQAGLSAGELHAGCKEEQ